MQSSDTQAAFATTRWSLIEAAANDASPDAIAAFDSLAASYWYPLYAFARRSGCTPMDAEDLTQGFFARLIEKDFLRTARGERGRFRTFLLTAFKCFMTDEWRKTQRQKRGGGIETISLDAEEAEDRYLAEPAEPQDAERMFQRRWAMAVLDQAFRRLELELTEVGRAHVFARLRCFLMGDKAGTLADAARDLNTSEAAVKMTVSRLRERARALIRDEIAQTVSTAAEVESEYQALVDALRS